MFCPACGQEISESANFCPNCGHRLNGSVPGSGLGETETTPLAAVKYGGFWRRAAAYVIDEILVFIIGIGAMAALGYVTGMRMSIYRGLLASAYDPGAVEFLILAVASWLYWSGLESSSTQATFGKMALGLKVTDLQGEPISFARATGRYFGKFLSVLLLGLGFMMAGWTAKKQALHDIMAGTLVVRKRGSYEPA